MPPASNVTLFCTSTSSDHAPNKNPTQIISLKGTTKKCDNSPSISPYQISTDPHLQTITKSQQKSSTKLTSPAKNGIWKINFTSEYLNPSGANFIDIVWAIYNYQCPTPIPTVFHCDLSKEAAENNLKILSRFNGSLEHALIADRNSITGAGAEFRPWQVLEHLFHLHPLWDGLRELLTCGATFQAKALDRDTQMRALKEGLAFGNHKGAKRNPTKLNSLLSDEATMSWSIVLPKSFAKSIPGLLINPMNVQKQNTINEMGNPISSERLTHDNSWDHLPDSLINSRCDLDLHNEVTFGHCLLQNLNYITFLRLRNPTARILITKTD